MDPQQRFVLDVGMSRKKLNKNRKHKKTLRGGTFPSRKITQNERFYTILLPRKVWGNDVQFWD